MHNNNRPTVLAPRLILLLLRPQPDDPPLGVQVPGSKNAPSRLKKAHAYVLCVVGPRVRSPGGDNKALFSMESTRCCCSSLGFVLFFFFLTGSWKARDCLATWCAARPIGAQLRTDENICVTFHYSEYHYDTAELT